MEQTDQLLMDSDLSIDRDVTIQLTETAKWTKFIGITIYILCGLILLVALIAGSNFSSIFQKYDPSINFSDVDITVLVAVLVIVTAILCAAAYFLVNFSSKIKTGLITENLEVFNKGLNSLKLYFIIAAIIGILGLISELKTIFSFF